MRRAARTDANHAEIVKALRAAGCFVQSLASIGKGCPDILFLCRQKWFLAEVKDGKKPPSRRNLTPHEQRWHELAGMGMVYVIESVEDALALVNGR